MCRLTGNAAYIEDLSVETAADRAHALVFHRQPFEHKHHEGTRWRFQQVRDQDGQVRALGKVATQDRIGTPSEVGEVVTFLLSDAASFVNGAAWAVDGGALSTIRH